MARVQRHSTSDVVYDLLRRDIIECRYVPLQRIFEPELARTFEVSRTPLREALKKLEVDGFVERKPAGGLVVARVDPEDAASLYMIRSLLEGLIARQAAERATPRDITELQNLVARMDLLAAEHPEEATEVGHKFHRQLAVVANNPRCDEVVGRVHRQLERYWALTVLKDAPRRQVAVGEHRLIIDAVAAGDPDRAEAVMRAHIAVGSANVVEGVRRYLDEVRQAEAAAG